MARRTGSTRRRSEDAGDGAAGRTSGGERRLRLLKGGKPSARGHGPTGSKQRSPARAAGSRPTGRSTPSGRAQPRRNGRYTAPIPRRVRHSPRWYPWVLLGLLIVGVLLIVLNYMSILPASPTNWYVVGGLVAILAAALMATDYR